MLRLLLLAIFLVPVTACAQSMDGMEAPEPTVSGDAIMPMRANTESRVSPNALAAQTFGTAMAVVEYGRPSVRDREVFGALVPYGEVWRTGANEAATLTVTEDMMVEGEALAAGTYSLFLIPREDEPWTVVVNGTAQQWGAFNYDEAADMLRADVIAETGRPVQEQMLVLFEDVDAEGATLIVSWDDIRVPIRLTL